ncbi:SDR family NAD(P)-dependent oxidoreductase [Haladaptatus halobius]|uniref:SDR family NAD(P)-dependent oxidoreductase n=1 Tax=Haladaptatus halobius TaxID=2884875 RepID=UPI001D09C04D|nr:SDR family oxidoreductase [Haladaptatus halobius]
MNKRFSVEDNVVLVTGGNRGIGRTIATEFAKAGARGVTVTSRTEEELEETVSLIKEAGGDGLAMAGDVRDSDRLKEIRDATIEEWGKLGVVVNNAAGSFGSPPEELSKNAFRTIVDINLNALFDGCRLAADHFIEEDGGTIINVSSVAVEGYPLAVHYAASKAGVESLTRSLAMAWEDENVRVNCIRPGWVNTPGIRQQYGVEASDTSDRSDTSRPVGKPEEIADIALFLASEASSYINGEVITAQGTPQEHLQNLENV